MLIAVGWHGEFGDKEGYVWFIPSISVWMVSHVFSDRDNCLARVRRSGGEQPVSHLARGWVRKRERSERKEKKNRSGLAGWKEESRMIFVVAETAVRVCCTKTAACCVYDEE